MALSQLQADILKALSLRRARMGYVAGGLALNREWPRRSEDIDIFHDTDDEIAVSAKGDIAALEAAGFRVSTDIVAFGLTEATVRSGYDSTVLQWMSETRWRFFPLVHDDLWGARLHQSDLAVNKVLAAGLRRKARDFADIHAITQFYCELAPLALAAAGKPPYLSPVRILEEMQRHLAGLSSGEYEGVLNLPASWTACLIRDAVAGEIERAIGKVRTVEPELTGMLVTDTRGVPRFFGAWPLPVGLAAHAASETHETIPQFKDIATAIPENLP